MLFEFSSINQTHHPSIHPSILHGALVAVAWFPLGIHDTVVLGSVVG
jgi:hypothetical protein